MQYCIIQYEIIRYDIIRYHMLRHDMISYNTISYEDMISYNTISYNTTSKDMIRYHKILNDTRHYDVPLNDVISFDAIQYFLQWDGGPMRRGTSEINFVIGDQWYGVLMIFQYREFISRYWEFCSFVGIGKKNQISTSGPIWTVNHPSTNQAWHCFTFIIRPH